MKPILTVGITSYNRVRELARCINSIKTKYKEDIEVLVSEDKSPLSSEICEMVNTLAKNSDYKIRFTTNEINLGYDMNLKAIIEKSYGKFVLLMSDDDALTDNCLDEIIEYLRTKPRCGVLYSPFKKYPTNKLSRVRGENNKILAGEANAARLVYDSILFSGLIFRKEFVENFNASRFKNYNYFQVYLFLQMIYNYGGYYFKRPAVLCIGDGENAYGISESSGGNELLANRKSIKSNLEFNKTLIKIIKIFDEDCGTHVSSSFARQYSIHSYSGLSIARGEGKAYFKEYWKMFNELEIKKYPITRIYYYILLFLGKEKADWLLGGIKKIAKRES